MDALSDCVALNAVLRQELSKAEALLRAAQFDVDSALWEEIEAFLNRGW